MLIHTLDTIKDYDGTPAVEPRQNPDGTVRLEPVTLRFLIWQVLNTPLPNEGWDPAEKAMCFDLSVRTTQQDEAELSADECAFVIARSAKVNTPPLADGRLRQMLTAPAEATLPADTTPA